LVLRLPPAGFRFSQCQLPTEDSLGLPSRARRAAAFTNLPVLRPGTPPAPRICWAICCCCCCCFLNLDMSVTSLMPALSFCAFCRRRDFRLAGCWMELRYCDRSEALVVGRAAVCDSKATRRSSPKVSVGLSGAASSQSSQSSRPDISSARSYGVLKGSCCSVLRSFILRSVVVSERED